MDLREINQAYAKVKKFYLGAAPLPKNDLATEVVEAVGKFGYLPIPYDLAKQQLSAHAILAGLEQIWHREGSMADGEFTTTEVSPLRRLGYSDPAWMTREQHKIESLNLMGLTENKAGKVEGCFANLLVKLLTSPAGTPQEKIAATTFYLLPPYQRDGAFNSAYCPASSSIDPALEDVVLKEQTGLDVEQQLQLFIALANLAGHPVVIDLLPQAGRYSKTVLVAPECFRWFHLPELLPPLKQKAVEVVKRLGSSIKGINPQALPLAGAALLEDIEGAPITYSQENWETSLKSGVRILYHEIARTVLKAEKPRPNSAEGLPLLKLQQQIRDQFAKLDLPQTLGRFSLLDSQRSLFLQTFIMFCEADCLLEEFRIEQTNQQMSEENQARMAVLIRDQIRQSLGRDLASEQELDPRSHLDLIAILQQNGWWPVEGGSWNSAYHPVFHRLSPNQGSGSYPVNDHYSYKGQLVNAFTGDMDIVAPWYFAFLDKAKRQDNLNHKVIDKYLDYCLSLYKRLRPNGFRIDHLDHSADCPFSLSKDGNPISYRAPLEVFRKISDTIRRQYDATFILFAEYMGWGDATHPNLYQAYHEHGIHLAISTDVVGEFRANAAVIVQEGNEVLSRYNQRATVTPLFSTTRILDNHDRSHPDILPALSNFTPERALLKWVKCLFLPGGRLAQRPVLYLDGNQTHTPNQAFADTFLKALTLTRNDNWQFFATFDSLLRFSLQDKTLMYGQARLLENSVTVRRIETTKPAINNTVSTWVVWPAVEHDSPLLVVAHEEIDDKTTAVASAPVLEVLLPAGLAPASELRMPKAGQLSDAVEDWLLAMPEVQEQSASELARFTFAWREDGRGVMCLPFLSPNHFRIFRLKRVN